MRSCYRLIFVPKKKNSISLRSDKMSLSVICVCWIHVCSHHRHLRNVDRLRGAQRNKIVCFLITSTRLLSPRAIRAQFSRWLNWTANTSTGLFDTAGAIWQVRLRLQIHGNTSDCWCCPGVTTNSNLCQSPSAVVKRKNSWERGNGRDPFRMCNKITRLYTRTTIWFHQILLFEYLI